MLVTRYRDLTVWNRSVDFVEEVYRLTQSFPAEERYTLTGQLRKAAISIGGNIAEGSARFTSRDYLNFLSNARGSTKEAESYLLVAQRLRFATQNDCMTAMGYADEINRMLFALRGSIRRRSRKAGS